MARVCVRRLTDANVSDSRLWFEYGKQLANGLASVLDADDDVFQAEVRKALKAFEKAATIDPHSSLAWVENGRLELKICIRSGLAVRTISKDS